MSGFSSRSKEKPSRVVIHTCEGFSAAYRKNPPCPAGASGKPVLLEKMLARSHRYALRIFPVHTNLPEASIPYYKCVR